MSRSRSRSSSSQSVPDTILDDLTEDEPDENELLKMLEEFDSQDTDIEERRATCCLQLDQTFHPLRAMPKGLDDDKLWRTLKHFAKKAYLEVVELYWPGEGEDQKRHRQNARRQIEAYTEQNGFFEPMMLPHMKDCCQDSTFDSFANPDTDRPIPLWNIWRSSSLNAPELVHVMQKNVGLVERMNGLLWRTGGNTRRNNLSIAARRDIATVADKVRKLRLGAPAKAKLLSSTCWAPPGTVCEHEEGGGDFDSDAEGANSDMEPELVDSGLQPLVVEEGEHWDSETSSSDSSSSSSVSDDDL
jgi:hypothetical protein